MSKIKAGYSRVEVNPNLGQPIEGYYNQRYAEGFLDNLNATAVAFDDGEKKAVVISLDAIGMNQVRSDEVRKAVAEKIGTEPEGVYIACTHTHLGLGFTASKTGLFTSDEDHKLINDNFERVKSKICDAAALAINDLKPSEFYYTKGIAENVAFIRRYRMKDGAVRTNPGPYGKDAVEALGEADNTVSHLIIKREGTFDIGIVNFQVHPDVISGSLISADYPHFVRDTYEKRI